MLATVLLALMGILLTPFVRDVVVGGDRARTIGVEGALMWLGMVSGTLAFLSLLDLLAAETVAGDAINYSPWLVLVCGISCLAGFGLRLVRVGQGLRGSRSTSVLLSLSFGAMCVAVLGSAYLAVTAADHEWFFRGGNSGTADVGGMGIGEVDCVRVLFRLRDEDALYRCPTSGVFNARYAEPFVPWPLYTTGRSRRLKEGIEALRDGT